MQQKNGKVEFPWCSAPVADLNFDRINCEFLPNFNQIASNIVRIDITKLLRNGMCTNATISSRTRLALVHVDVVAVAEPLSYITIDYMEHFTGKMPKAIENGATKTKGKQQFHITATLFVSRRCLLLAFTLLS